MAERGASGARSEDALRRHYGIEVELANRLRTATAAERASLYTIVYDELFARIPDHPQLAEDTRGRARQSWWEWCFLRRFVTRDSVLVEIGAGDCALSAHAATTVAQVIALDVSPAILSCGSVLSNVQRVVIDGVSFPLPGGSVDVAYSNQLMEHLHPEDCQAQLAEVLRVLRPGGRYVCITPNRLTGPHDISRYYDEEARGLHLKEYTLRELRDLLRATGFAGVRAYVGTRGVFARVPLALMLAAERGIGALPEGARHAFRDSVLALPLLQIRVAAVR